jgi:hypothetical protein
VNFKVFSANGELVDSLPNHQNFRLVPQWDPSWGEEPFQDMNGNFLFSKKQLSILLFFDRLDGGILPFSPVSSVQSNDI